ncbi:hypothetical protein THASP1DRAFT_28578 [Thamnocephalis sphaerospora]|uniref:BED-type domain-containing protein n=1 Tax=Thamnocephalis sphaerospora TaxID=78915 RepID=A0A4P9XTW4_9FUNG|nr:hypothetical protein THASP1DRAFT_28578 [Thamnocephalis sphaerospora]|eukprot:RKP09635.1 hypothetical protein THASP1DRAFT_28578 [Thamnocephalis sphaerospora]
MAKKKKKQPQSKPWCWYCEREFDDEKVLITHQRAKHFKCPQCNKKMNTTGGLSIHYAQVHKETLRSVPNAIEGRDTVDIEIFGMEGVPHEDLIAHQAGYSAANPPMPKRIRIDPGINQELTPEQLKEQLARHQAYVKGQAPAPAPVPPPPAPYGAYYGAPPPMPMGPPGPGMPPYQPPYHSPMGGYPGGPMGPPPHSPYGYPGAPPMHAGGGYPPAPGLGSGPSTAAVSATASPTPSAASSMPPPSTTAASVSASSEHATPTLPPPSAPRPPAVTSVGPVLVYDDNAVSVEEKRASLPQYRYIESN